MESKLASRRILWALIVEKACFFFALAFVGPYTILTALASQLTTSAVVIGSVTTVWNGASFAPVIFMARWIRGRTERIPILQRAMFVRALAFPLVAAWLLITRAQNPDLTLVVLTVGMLMFCLSDGSAAVPYIDTVARILTSFERSRMTWQGILLGGVLGILGSVVVQLVLAPGGVAFPVNFAVLMIAAGAVLLVALGAISLVPERYVQARHVHHVDEEGGGGPRQVREILRCDSAFRRMLLARLLTGADQMAVPFYTVLALTVLKLPPESVGWFVAAQTVGALLGPVVFGRIAERAGAQRVILAAAVAQVSAPLIGLLFVSLGNAALAIGAGIALVFVATGLSNSSMALGYFNYLLDFCPAHDRPTYLAILSTAGLASMLMPVLGGVIAQTVSYALLFGVTAVLVGAGALVALTLPDRRAVKGNVDTARA
jgi:hypothetical protein